MSPQNTVLIVDSDESFLSTCSEALRKSGFQVYTCEQWGKMAAFVRRAEPDLVLLAQELPSMNGAELCKIIKDEKRNEALKVALVFENGDSGAQSVVDDCGSVGFVSKKYDRMQLVRKIKEMMGQKLGIPAQKPENIKERLGNVLLIDDSTTIRRLCKNTLSGRYTSNILEAENGSEGLKIMTEGAEVDLILLDLNMPVLDGLGFLKEAKKTAWFRKVPIIICSTEDGEDEVLEGLTLGATSYLVKPFSPDTLVKTVEKVVCRN